MIYLNQGNYFGQNPELCACLGHRACQPHQYRTREPEFYLRLRRSEWFRGEFAVRVPPASTLVSDHHAGLPALARWCEVRPRLALSSVRRHTADEPHAQRLHLLRLHRVHAAHPAAQLAAG